jgi:aspartokinase/homoserine dehydrogenase 1
MAMLNTLTMKFGGTSVGGTDAIARVCDIVHQIHGRTSKHVAIVVSAMSGVTDMLQAGTIAAAAGRPDTYQPIIANLRVRHQAVVEDLFWDRHDSALEAIDELLDQYERCCESIAVLREATPRALDYTMGIGELLSSILLAAALRQAGLPGVAVDASHIIVTDNRFQSATPQAEPTLDRACQEIIPLLEAGKIPVITGFIGATPDGIRTTLGRGGSDYSAALVGLALQSDEVWIWTDVDGIMTADPRIIPGAKSIGVLSYAEVGELAFFGAKVLHPKTIRPVVEAQIPLRVKNTFNPANPGTLILTEPRQNGSIKAVTGIPEMSLITVAGRGMMGVPGIAARTFSAVASTATSVLLISQASSEQSICFVVPRSRSEAVVDSLRREFDQEMARGDIDLVSAQDNVSVITVVGAGMRGTPGIAGRIFTATGEQGVNVIAIAQGSSECSISLVVDGSQHKQAMSAIHALALQRPEARPV